jgi:hypothetical protein
MFVDLRSRCTLVKRTAWSRTKAQAGRASEIQQASEKRGAAQAAYRAHRSSGSLVVNERVDIPPADIRR